MTNDQVPIWEFLRRYSAIMRHAVTLWKNLLNTRELEWFPQGCVVQWLERIINTIHVLELSHLYDELSSLSVAIEGSGFPSRTHVRQLELMRKESALTHCVKDAKRMLLAHVLSTGSVSVPLFERVMKARAYEVLHDREVLAHFRMVSLVQYRTDNDRRAYVCVWERYVVQPLPVLYVMLFEVSQSWVPNGDDLTSFIRVLREDTEIVGSLEQLACDIDRSHAAIHPKWLGRVIGGPVLIAGITQDDNLMQRALEQTEDQGDQLATASRLIYEYVVSCGEQPVHRLTDPHGNRHTCVQEYAVRSFDEHHKRGVTHIEKHLFAPHGVVQSLTDESRRTLDHTIHTF